MMNGETHRRSVISRGIRTPVIKSGDNLEEIVISAVVEQVGELHYGDIIGVTEAVVAIAQGNFCTHQNISDDIQAKFIGAKSIAIVDPIQSRNRFLDILKAVAKTPTLEKVYIIMTYPTDEVGNRLVSDNAIMRANVNPYKDWFTAEDFYKEFGKPCHPFTGKNYIKEYIDACEGKGEVIVCNDFSILPWLTDCEDYLICSIHRRDQTREILEKTGAKRILDLSEIMNAPVNGSGYNEEFGLYGSNLMHGDRLKLMPRNCKDFVENIRAKIYARYKKIVEVFVYGDGAFKDPVGGIWELADPRTTLASTDGLKGTPKEVKLKYLASKFEGKSASEIAELVEKEGEHRRKTEVLTGEASLGTTPRQITDLLASLADLTTGSGDRQTPVVHIRNYL